MVKTWSQAKKEIKLMEFKHPSWYKALRKQRKEFEASERAQADKRASEQAGKRANEQAKATSGSRASKK